MLVLFLIMLTIKGVISLSFHQKPHVYVDQVSLAVENLGRSLAFYQEVIGMKILEQSSTKAVLTANGKTPLITIYQPGNIRPKQPRTTGLYHFALLLPTRADLGRVINHLLKLKYPIQGGSDHLVSEALYLADPDGNGIEIYVDRPDSTWNWNNGEVVMTTEPLDIKNLLEVGQGEWESLPSETIMGHIHLHVSELEKVNEFYCQGLGFEVVSTYGTQALFISTGGYHHHIGLNVWNGIGAPQPLENSVGLINYSLQFPSEEERAKAIERIEKLGYDVTKKEDILLTQDPSGNRIQLLISNV